MSASSYRDVPSERALSRACRNHGSIAEAGPNRLMCIDPLGGQLEAPSFSARTDIIDQCAKLLPMKLELML